MRVVEYQSMDRSSYEAQTVRVQAEFGTSNRAIDMRHRINSSLALSELGAGPYGDLPVQRAWSELGFRGDTVKGALQWLR